MLVRFPTGILASHTLKEGSSAMAALRIALLTAAYLYAGSAKVNDKCIAEIQFPVIGQLAAAFVGQH